MARQVKSYGGGEQCESAVEEKTMVWSGDDFGLQFDATDGLDWVVALKEEELVPIRGDVSDDIFWWAAKSSVRMTEPSLLSPFADVLNRLDSLPAWSVHDAIDNSGVTLWLGYERTPLYTSWELLENINYFKFYSGKCRLSHRAIQNLELPHADARTVGQLLDWISQPALDWPALQLGKMVILAAELSSPELVKSIMKTTWSVWDVLLSEHGGSVSVYQKVLEFYEQTQTTRFRFLSIEFLLQENLRFGHSLPWDMITVPSFCADYAKYSFLKDRYLCTIRARQNWQDHAYTFGGMFRQLIEGHLDLSHTASIMRWVSRSVGKHEGTEWIDAYLGNNPNRRLDFVTDYSWKQYVFVDGMTGKTLI